METQNNNCFQTALHMADSINRSTNTPTEEIPQYSSVESQPLLQPLLTTTVTDTYQRQPPQQIYAGLHTNEDED